MPMILEALSYYREQLHNRDFPPDEGLRTAVRGRRDYHIFPTDAKLRPATLVCHPAMRFAMLSRTLVLPSQFAPPFDQNG